MPMTSYYLKLLLFTLLVVITLTKTTAIDVVENTEISEEQGVKRHTSKVGDEQEKVKKSEAEIRNGKWQLLVADRKGSEDSNKRVKKQKVEKNEEKKAKEERGNEESSHSSVKHIRDSGREFRGKTSNGQDGSKANLTALVSLTTLIGVVKPRSSKNQWHEMLANPTAQDKRFKRQQRPLEQLHAQALIADQQMSSYPTVPIPAPPPFPSNLALPQFPNAHAGKGFSAFSAFAAAGSASSAYASSISTSNTLCGGILKSRHGIIQTPNFPHKFSTPIECVWIIDASELPTASASGNTSIIVYLSQLYVLGGLKFTEYMYYSDDYKVPAHRVFALTEDDVTQVAWVQFNSQYLEIRFAMSSLDGTHLRALDRLLDVYGFNITYEVQTEVKQYQCNTLQCRFLGHCYAQADFSSYGCSCFPGFSGIDCGRGPLCEDPHTNICQNGGTCKHIGDAAITCHCPAGYKGTKCEIPEINEITMGCTANSSASDCQRECDFDKHFDGTSLPRASKNSARTGKTRYEVTIRLGANLTAFYRNSEPERRASDHLPSLLERHLMRVLRNFNITKISDLELISNSTDRLDITFHFFGVKGDSNRIREAITRMVERGRIGNITLVSNYHLFDENPPLNLLDMAINQKSAIREDSEFIISCTAQGSSRMQYQWFKDGAIVNASKATREIWTTVLPPETKDIFTAILGVTKASRMDEGIYTCKVIDWGVEQCRSLHVHIKSPPRLRVDPASVTLQRGDSLRVRCLSPGNDDIKRYAQLGYSWTRNGVLFQSDPATVMWEDLYPDGSILKINKIQKSAEYTCMVSNTVKPVSKSVYITVIDHNAVHVCHSETRYGVRWPTSAPGNPIISDCPRGFEGHSRRICEKRDSGNSSWLLPDFSMCVRDQLLQIYNKFRALSAGFQQSNSSAILKACFEYTIRRHKNFLPGEAGFLIDMLHEIDSYLQFKGTQLEREMAAEITLHILDKVMQNAQSLNTQQQIKKLQLLTQSAALNRETIAASQLATSTSSSSTGASGGAGGGNNGVQPASSSVPSSSNSLAAQADSSATTSSLSPSLNTATTASNEQHQQHHVTSLKADMASNAAAGGVVGNTNSILMVDEDSLSLDRLNSLRIYMTSVKMLPFNLRIYGDDLFSDQLYMDIGLSASLLNIMVNSTIFASVISYKNLKSFLPKTYYMRGSDPKETDYILASRIIQTWLFQSNRSNDNFREPVDLPFEAGHVEIIFQHEAAPKDGDWVAVCGHDYKASFESTWRSDLCITKNLMENITRCICPLSGTYVVMLTKRSYIHSQPLAPQRPIFVIISCACCLLQSCSAFLILLPIWYNRRCAITFLKMQFCISTSSIMVIFLLGFLKMLPVNWQAVISSSLASLLLLGVSTLIAIPLVIHSELVPKKMVHINRATVATNTPLNTTTLNRKEQQQLHHQQQDLEKRRNSTSGNISVTNITQINNSANANVNASVIRRHSSTITHSSTNTATGTSVVELNFPSGIRGAIGISWLLPLLFAIASPLICSIIGKWPQNWWLQIMSNAATASTTMSAIDSGWGTASGNDYFLTHTPPLLNGDNLLGTTNAVTATAITASSVAISTTTTTGNSLPTATAAGTATSSSSASSSFTSSSSTSSFPSKWTHPHNGFSSATANTYESGITTAYGDGNPAPTPSLSFIIFICVDLLFILLFCALFAILIKKLLWLRHKNHNVRVHPLDKFNMAMRRRIGLLYRSGCLLLIKLTTDALFIAYVNTVQDSLWCYAFGTASIFLGFSILYCFVIKAECNLRGGPTSGGSGAGKSGILKKKLSASKTSLDENYCTGSISSPLSFYTNHEKEKENESGIPPSSLTTLLPPQQIEISSGVQLPLTIISTAPRCQMMQQQPLVGGGLHEHTSSVKTFIGGAAGSLDRKIALPHVTCLQQEAAATAGISSPATRCCNILGSSIGGSSGQPQDLPLASGSISYYDAYGAVTVGMTGSLNRRLLSQHQQSPHVPQEFVGVETLDILQGVSPDSIIGIRTSNVIPTEQYLYHQRPQHHHQAYMNATTLPASAIVSMSGVTTNIATATNCISNYKMVPSPVTATNVTTSSVTTQTPKAQKRVTIMEPTTHTFDPLLPTMIAVSGTALATPSPHLLPTTPTPIITITASSADENNIGAVEAPTNATSGGVKDSTNPMPDDENSTSGMFDRITHDLDYLLNRTNEIPGTSASLRLNSGEQNDHENVPPPPLPPTASIPLKCEAVSMKSNTKKEEITQKL